MKDILRKFIIFLAAPLCLILYLLRPFIIIRFGMLQSSRIGGILPSAENYLHIKNKINSNKRKYFDIISFEDQICNEQIALLVSRKIKIFPYKKILRLIIVITNFWFSDKSHLIFFTSIAKYDHFLKKEPKLDFTDDEKNQALNMMNNIGINKDDHWVCIHNRDSEYLNINYQDRDWSYHDFRDYNITSMVSTCNYFLSKNYYVIRIGKNASSKIELKHPRLIDYPFSSFKNDLLEIYLMANCKLYIGCSSGPANIPIIYTKPLLLTNYNDIHLLNLLKHNQWLLILKVFFDLKTNKILKLDDIFSRKLHNLFRSEDYSKLGIKVVENTPDEVLNASIELEQRENNTWIDTPSSTLLQKKFWNIIDKYSNKNKFNQHNLFISSYFLKKYENVLF